MQIIDKVKSMMDGPIDIELIPVSQWRQNARCLLHRRQWDKIRHYVYRRAEFKCEACGATNTELHAHEQWKFGFMFHWVWGFVPWFLWKQKLVGFRCLCEMCHLATHLGFAENEGRQTEAMEHLKRVNGWNQFLANHHKSIAFKKVRRLGQRKNWFLDIDLAHKTLEGIDNG